MCWRHQGQDEECDRVKEVIEHRLIPNVTHAVTLECSFQGVRAKGAERDRQKTKNGGESNEQGGHRGQISYLLRPEKKTIGDAVCRDRRTVRK